MLTGYLLDDVIKDMEAGRQNAALANAKQALEEAFSSKFKEMFGDRIEDVEPKFPNRNISIHILKD